MSGWRKSWRPDMPSVGGVDSWRAYLAGEAGDEQQQAQAWGDLTNFWMNQAAGRGLLSRSDELEVKHRLRPVAGWNPRPLGTQAPDNEQSRQSALGQDRLSSFLAGQQWAEQNLFGNLASQDQTPGRADPYEISRDWLRSVASAGQAYGLQPGQQRLGRAESERRNQTWQSMMQLAQDQGVHENAVALGRAVFNPRLDMQSDSPLMEHLYSKKPPTAGYGAKYAYRNSQFL